MSIVLKVLAGILFFAVVLFAAERVIQWDVFGPRVSGIFSSNPEVKREVRSLIKGDEFRLSQEEWKNGMLHASELGSSGIQYLAHHEDVLTTPKYYVVCEITEGERKYYRIRKGTDIFWAIRKYHDERIAKI